MHSSCLLLSFPLQALLPGLVFVELTGGELLCGLETVGWNRVRNFDRREHTRTQRCFERRKTRFGETRVEQRFVRLL